MLSALNFLALQQVVHRDVKPENILFKKMTDSNGLPSYDFQLCDCGLATRIDGADYHPGFTELFTAPETQGSCSGLAAEQTCMMDIWSRFATPVFRANLLPTKFLVLPGHHESIGGR